jgi:hypothetical protein
VGGLHHRGADRRGDVRRHEAQDRKAIAGRADGPTTEDGQAVMRYWGTHWIDDTFQLAWKVVGRDPIKAKGGK